MKTLSPVKHSTTPARSSSGSRPFFQQTPSASQFFQPSIQAKLTMSQPGDRHEREADQVSEQVAQKIESPFFAPAPVETHSQSETPIVNRISRLPAAVQTEPEELELEESGEEETIQCMADPWLSNGAGDDDSDGDGNIQMKPMDSGIGRLRSNTIGHSARSIYSSRIPLLNRHATHPEGRLITPQPAQSTPFRARGPPVGEDHFETTLRESKGRGQPLPETSRREMEGAFGADFSSVRIHTDSRAQRLTNQAGARAFAHEGEVYFNRGQFQPESSGGRRLLAHELTHVVQQGRAIRPERRPDRGSVSHSTPASSTGDRAIRRQSSESEVQLPLTRAPPGIDRGIIPDWALERINSAAEAIPGYTLMTVLIGHNPILGRDVEWSARNFFRGAAGLIPFGTTIFDKLDESGVIDPVFNFVSAKIDEYNLSFSRAMILFRRSLDQMDFLTLSPIEHNVGVFRRNFSGLLSDITSFAGDIISKLIEVFKDLAVQAVRALFGENSAAYDLITQILGEDPLTGEPREWNTADFLRAALRVFGFENHLAKMEETGQVEKAAAWLDMQVALLVSAFTGLITGVTDLWSSLTLEKVVRPDRLLTDTLNIVLGFVSRLAQFALNLASKILELIKEAIISLLKNFLHGKPGYRLFTVVLGRDPVTGEPVPRTPANFIKGFLEFVPKGLEIYENLVEGNAIGKAMQGLEQQVAELGLSPAAILERVTHLWQSFSIDDLMNPIGAFERVAGTLFGFIRDVLTLAGRIGLKLLEILFEVVMGSAGARVLGILKKGRDTFLTIVKDPVAFVGNLVNAVKQGFQQFTSNIWEHLKTGLFGWLFGALEGAGLQLPQQWDLKGILNLTLQILGLTWQNIRPKLVRHLGEPMVSRLETAFEFVRLIVTEGLGAAWEKIVEFFTGNIVSMVIDGIKDWVVTKIITAAVTRLATMLNPAGAVVQAILAIYNTIMFFIERIQQIMALVESVINSISRIAAGAIGDAANFVEQSMARTLPVIISFLARLIGLGGISEKIKNIIKKIQAPISKALDKVIAWIVRQARRLFGRGGSQEGDQESDGQGETSLELPFSMQGKSHTLTLNVAGDANVVMASNNAGRLSGKVQAAITKLSEEDTSNRNVSRRIRDLNGIKSKAESVEEYLERDEDNTITREERAEMQRQGSQLVGLIHNYANTHNADDISGILEEYPGPQAGLYSSLGGEGPLFDGTTREAHHAPAAELASSMGTALNDAADYVDQHFDNDFDEQDLYGTPGIEAEQAQEEPTFGGGAAILAAAYRSIDWGAPLRSAASQISSTGAGGLPAILVHSSTHRVRGTGARIHGSELRPALISRLEAQGFNPAHSITTTTGKLAVKAVGKTYQRFLQDTAQRITGVPRSQVSQAIGMAGSTVIRTAYRNAAALHLNQVEAALNASNVDGSPEEKNAAMSQLRSLATSVWENQLLSSLF